jgi:diguanylate cyclase (GGDEF)-like protein
MPLIWAAFLLSKRMIVLTAFLAILPEALLWLNIQYALVPAIPTPLFPVSGQINWPAVWKLFLFHFLPLLLLPWQLGLLRKKVSVSADYAPGFGPVSKKSAAGAGKPGVVGAKEDESTQDAKDLARFKRENKAQAAQDFRSIHDGKNSLVGSDFKGLLDTLVFFCNKNFKAHSSLGFLSIDGGRTFIKNAQFTRSSFLRDQIILHPGSGLVGESAILPDLIFSTGNIANYHGSVEYYTRENEVNSIMIAKIIDEESKKALGLLVVDSTAIQAFSETDKELLGRFAEIAAKLISRTQMSKQLQRESQESEMTFAIAKKLSQENTSRGVIGVLVENLRRTFFADRLCLCDFNPAEGTVRLMKISGDTGGLEEGITFNIDDPNSLYAQVFLTLKSSFVTDFDPVHSYRFFSGEAAPPRELLLAPWLNEKGGCIAVIGLESNKGGVFQKRSLTVLQIILTNASTAYARAQLVQRLEKQANYDGLTKIPNHRSFQDTLTRRLAEADKQESKVALLLMDIDHFKNFNDTFGHPLGDKVLQQVAQAIKAATRDIDYPARYGGEEFVVILNESNHEQAQHAAERVRKAVESVQIPFEDKILSVTVSIGAAVYPDDAQQKQMLIDSADKAMYHSKENGRNRVSLFRSIKR